MNSYLKSTLACKHCGSILYFNEGREKLLCKQCNSYVQLQQSAFMSSFAKITKVSAASSAATREPHNSQSSRSGQSLFSMLASLKDEKKVSIRIQ